MPKAIETHHLTKRFPRTKRYRELLAHPFKKEETTALQGVNIQVDKGELFGLLGPNGAGKTTLIKILCTLILPSEGRALVNGFDVEREGKEIRRTIGYVLGEERSFYWRLTGRQNLRFFATLNNIPPPRAEEAIEEAVELVRLKRDIDNIYQNYSSGTKQKLAIARGMLTKPQILFLDEPTRNLDPLSTYKLRNFIADVIVGEEKKTVIIATNNLQEAQELCDRVAVIHEGQVKMCESLKGIRNKLMEKNRYILKLRGSEKHLQETVGKAHFNGNILSVSPEPYESNGDLFRIEMNAERDEISQIVEKLVLSGLKLEACYLKESSLNEIFSRIFE